MQTPTLGTAPIGKDFRTKVLGKVHPHAGKAATELIENAISKGASMIHIRLVKAADVGASQHGNTEMLIAETDTYVDDMQGVFEFAHSSEENKGLLNNMGIGSKVFGAQCGEETQTLVLTKDAHGNVGCGRAGTIIDKLQNPDNPNHISQVIANATIVSDKVKFDWHGDYRAQHIMCTNSPWHHTDFSLDIAANRMCSLLTQSPEGEERTFFVYYNLCEDLPFRNQDARLQFLHAGKYMDLAESLQQMYVGSMICVMVNDVRLDFSAHPGSVCMRETYYPIHVPGIATPLMHVGCAQIADPAHKDMHLTPYNERKSGAFFTYGWNKVLNVDNPYAMFQGAVFGIHSGHELDLTPFKQSGEVRRSQYESLVKYVCCGNEELKSRFEAEFSYAAFKTWKPRQEKLWNRIGTSTLSHVVFNVHDVSLNPPKTEVKVSVPESLCLAHLRFHVFAWSVALAEDKEFVAPFSTSYEEAVRPLPRGRGQAIIPYVGEEAPRKHKRKRVTVSYKELYGDLLSAVNAYVDKEINYAAFKSKVQALEDTKDTNR